MSLIKGSSKHPWSTEEDNILRDCMTTMKGRCWSEIAAYLPGRAGKQCRERWHNHLDPTVQKGPWTEEEDKIIFEQHKLHGNQWAIISKMVPGRTDNAVKNRYYSTCRRLARHRARAAADSPASGASASAAPLDPKTIDPIAARKTAVPKSGRKSQPLSHNITSKGRKLVPPPPAPPAADPESSSFGSKGPTRVSRTKGTKGALVKRRRVIPAPSVASAPSGPVRVAATTTTSDPTHTTTHDPAIQLSSAFQHHSIAAPPASHPGSHQYAYPPAAFSYAPSLPPSGLSPAHHLQPPSSTSLTPKHQQPDFLNYSNLLQHIASNPAGAPGGSALTPIAAASALSSADPYQQPQQHYYHHHHHHQLTSSFSPHRKPSPAASIDSKATIELLSPKTVGSSYGGSTSMGPPLHHHSSGLGLLTPTAALRSYSTTPTNMASSDNARIPRGITSPSDPSAAADAPASASGKTESKITAIGLPAPPAINTSVPFIGFGYAAAGGSGGGGVANAKAAAAAAAATAANALESSPAAAAPAAAPSSTGGRGSGGNSASSAALAAFLSSSGLTPTATPRGHAGMVGGARTWWEPPATGAPSGSLTPSLCGLTPTNGLLDLLSPSSNFGGLLFETLMTPTFARSCRNSSNPSSTPTAAAAAAVPASPSVMGTTGAATPTRALGVMPPPPPSSAPRSGKGMLYAANLGKGRKRVAPEYDDDDSDDEQENVPVARQLSTNKSAPGAGAVAGSGANTADSAAHAIVI